MIYSRSDIQTAIINCALSSLSDSPSIPRTHEWKGSEVMITAYVHHISSVHRQLSVWTDIYTGCIYMRPYYLWENWLLTGYGWPRKYGLWDAESVTVLGRTFPASDSWKSIASERPSNAIESLGGEPEYR